MPPACVCGAGGPAQSVPQDGFSAARRGRITLPAQLASRGAAAGGVRGPPSGPTAPAGAQGVGAAAGGRAVWAVAAPSRLCMLPTLHRVGLGVGDHSRLSPGSGGTGWRPGKCRGGGAGGLVETPREPGTQPAGRRPGVAGAPSPQQPRVLEGEGPWRPHQKPQLWCLGDRCRDLHTDWKVGQQAGVGGGAGRGGGGGRDGAGGRTHWLWFRAFALVLGSAGPELRDRPPARWLLCGAAA